MYNKLFSKMLFSSIWVEPYPTRIVWVTFLAAMDEDGVVHLATVKNVAALAQVTVDEAEQAVAVLESPDPSSSSSEHDGRRIERFPGGWLVLNAKVYRDIATRDQARQRTAERVKRHRDRSTGNASVTVGNGDVTPEKRSSNGSVTVSETETEAETETKNSRSSASDDHALRVGFTLFWEAYPRKVAKQAAWKAFRALRPSGPLLETLIRAVYIQAESDAWRRDGGKFVPHCATWLRGRRWEDELVAPAASAGSSTADAERARTVELLKEREKLLNGARSDDRW